MLHLIGRGRQRYQIVGNNAQAVADLLHNGVPGPWGRAGAKGPGPRLGAGVRPSRPGARAQGRSQGPRPGPTGLGA